MSRMHLLEIVMKLVGPVVAVGDSHVDQQRLNNLQALTELIDLLLGEVSQAAVVADRPEASMKAIGIHAREFLQNVKEADIE